MSEAMTKQEAIATLRELIIENLRKDYNNAYDYKYVLTNLTCDDVSSCFPDETDFPWDMARFKLDLNNGSLFVSLSCHSKSEIVSDPMSPAERIDLPLKVRSLTAAEFHAIVLKYSLNPLLKAFETDEDWAALLDSRLKSVADKAYSALQKENEADRARELLEYAISIPSDFEKGKPQMDLMKVSLTEHGPSGRSFVLTQKDCKYYLNDKPLSPQAFFWMELQVSYAAHSLKKDEEDDFEPDCMSDDAVPDEECDVPEEYADAANLSDDSRRMDIFIKRTHEKEVELIDYPAPSAFTELLNDFETLYTYGSITASERHDLRKKIQEHERSWRMMQLKSFMRRAWGKLRRGDNRK